jgi:hypothetical protein
MTEEPLRAKGDLAFPFTKAGNEPKSCKASGRNCYLAPFLCRRPRPGAAVSRAHGLVSPGKKGSDAATLTTRNL